MKTSGINVSGLSVSQIMDMDWETLKQLSRSDIATLTSRLASAGNKRLRRLEKANLTMTPAYHYVMASGGNFSVKGKDIDELRAEFNRVRIFLSPETKTSTVKGAREIEKKVKQSFERTVKGKKKNFTEAQRKKFWEAYRQLEENKKALVYNIGSDTILKELRDEQVKDARKSSDNLLETFLDSTNDLEDLYIKEVNQDIDFYDLESKNDVPEDVKPKRKRKYQSSSRRKSKRSAKRTRHK